MKHVRSVECETCGFKSNVDAKTPEWECCPKCGGREKIYELYLLEYELLLEAMEIAKKITPVGRYTLHVDDELWVHRPSYQALLQRRMGVKDESSE